MYGEHNELYAAERDESRSARRALTETQRVTACGHLGGFTRAGTCRDCGEEPL